MSAQGHRKRVGFVRWDTRHMPLDLLDALKRFAAERHWTIEHAHNVALAAGLAGVLTGEKERADATDS